MTKARLDDIVAVVTLQGLLICMKCASEKDLAAVISEDDLILRGTTGGDTIICDRCKEPVEG